MLDIKIKEGLVVLYYNSIIEKKWNTSTIKNKLAYLKRKALYEDHLALQCANSKFKIENYVEKLNENNKSM